MKIPLLCFVAMLSASPLYAQEPNTFKSEPFRLTISGPQGWKFVPAEFPTVDFEFHDKDLTKLVAKRETVPIVRIAKPVAGNRTISPSIQIFVVSDDGKTPKEYLSSTAAGAGTAYQDFQVTQKASDTTLNGIKAAALEATFTTAYPGGRTFPTLNRMWAIPRDKMLFIITVTGQPDDLKALTKDIDLILNSVRFTNE